MWMDDEPWSPAVGAGGAALLAGAVLLRRHPAAAACLALVALGLRVVPAERLVVTFLAVGQGDAALVEWPDGRRWLVDGGPSSDQLLRYLRRRGLRGLDAVVLSHAHDDHMGGLLPVMQSLPVRAFWVPRAPLAEEAAYTALWDAARSQGSTLVLPDDVPVRGLSGARIEHPRSGWRARGRDTINDESLVLRLDHGRHRVLFTGDVELQAEALLARVLGPMTVVKVAHHGSRSSSSPAFVARTRPALAVVSAGRDNRFGHPHSQALGAWTLPAEGAACGPTDADGSGCRTRLLRTDRLGSLEWSSDGERWRLRAWSAARGWVELDSGS
jgi:competence protein ComEC